MTTVIFYNFILLGSTFFVWLSEKMRYKLDRWLFLGVAFFIVVAPAMLRYEIGVDYFSYKIIFENIRDGVDSFSQSSMEPGYYALNFIISSLELDFEWLIAVVALLIAIFFFMSYPSENKTIFHFVLWGVVYFDSFTYLRSILAGSVLLYAVMQFYNNEKYLRFIFLVFLAASFHKSAVLFLIIPLISLGRFYGLIIRAKYFLPLIILLVFLFAEKIVNLIFNNPVTSILGFSNYADSVYNREVELGSGLGVAAILVFLTYAIYIESRSLRETKILTFIVFAATISLVLSAHVVIFERLLLLFIIAYPVASYLVSQNKKILLYKVSLSSIALLFLYFIIMFNFNKAILSGSTDYTETCKGDRITPYVSVFNKEDSKRHPHLTRYQRWCEAHFK